MMPGIGSRKRYTMLIKIVLLMMLVGLIVAGAYAGSAAVAEPKNT